MKDANPIGQRGGWDKKKRDSERSVLSIEARRDGGASCVLRGPFMTELMDAIVARVAAHG